MRKLLYIIAGFLAGTVLIGTAYAAFPPSNVSQGGTGWGLIQQGGILYGSSDALHLATTSQGTGGQVLSWQNGVPTWVATTSVISLTTTGTSGAATYSAGVLNIPQYTSGTFPFTQDSNFSQNAVSTSTALWFKGTPFSLFASSTAEFSQASTTLFTNSGSTWLTGLTGPNSLAIDSTGQVYATGTTTAGTGLTYNAGSPGNFSVNNSQSIATLSNLTTNGIVYTSGSAGTLNVSGFSAGNIPYVNQGGTGLAYVGTSTATCSTGIGCSTFTVIGGINPSFTNTYGYPFTSDATNFSTAAQATSTVLWLKASTNGYSLFASSTAEFSQSTTTLATVGNLWDTSITSALSLFDANHKETAYAGSNPCTNQVALSINASGVISCTSVTNAMLSNSSLTVTAGGGLSGGGSVSLGSSITLTNPFAISTSSIAKSNLAYFGTTVPTQLLGVGTSTISGGNGLTISGTGAIVGSAVTVGNAFEISTTSLSQSGVVYVGTATPTNFLSVATTSETCGSGVSCSAHAVLTGGGQISLATISQGLALANAAQGTNVPIGVATSSWFGVGTGGQLLGWNSLTNSVQFFGTTTAGTGLTYNGGSPGNFSVNTSQNITTLSGLTNNGFVYTSGGGGTLNVGSFSANTIPYINGAGTGISFISTSTPTIGSGLTYSGTSGYFVGGSSGTLNQIEHRAFSYSTTTWAGTTTIPISIGYGEVWNNITCSVQPNGASVGVDFYWHSGAATNHVLPYLPTASSTPNVETVTSNGTITAAATTSVDIGTPVSSPTSVNCQVKDTF